MDPGPVSWRDWFDSDKNVIKKGGKQPPNPPPPPVSSPHPPSRPAPKESNLTRKLALLNLKSGMRHRLYCTFDPSPYSSDPDGDFCTCDLHQRKQAVQDEIDKL